MLELKNITHSYGTTPVLKGMNLVLAPGQRIALMGPSGVGKTTLLRVALGLLKPDEGTVQNNFRKTAAVFQEPRLLPWRTAAENVNLVLADDRSTMAEARLCLQRMNLAEAAPSKARSSVFAIQYGKSAEIISPFTVSACTP